VAEARKQFNLDHPY